MRLRLVGLTWRSLARQIGVSPQVVQQTAAGAPSIPVEEAIAAAIGIAPRDLFHEHWTKSGDRIPIARPGLHKAKSSRPRAAAHAQKSEAA
ncbi:helix-turn-helix domain-containing protein [Ancylobacter lacus]|uniref:helix-turn-helix domain-containing protein n=1 Tax=Ancylobacter lacus TaxID=2579970 RepID=UPI001BCEDE6E|nr:helix-turn-helix domain-containing protein [Ancylobacter lacus]MBS7540642.1 helix-turn-helix domain-containing protein [Ancylobacter lacus]